MKFVLHGNHEHGTQLRIDCGVLDLHGRPLIFPSIVPVEAENDKRSSFTVTVGRAFVIDHTDSKLQPVCDWMRSHKSFQLLDKEALPRNVANPHLSTTPHRHFHEQFGVTVMAINGTKPSTGPRYGSTVAVASMGNSMLAQYYYLDTRVGAGAATSAGTYNGLQARLADGRSSVDLQDMEDAAYIKRTLSINA